MDLFSTGNPSSSLNLPLQLEHRFVGSLGLQLKGQPAIVFIDGKISEKELTNSDLPDPLGPEIRAPPILGSIALRIRTVFAVS